MYRTTFALVLGLALAGAAQAAEPERFRAHLAGFNAGGAPIATNATGEARVEIIDGGSAVEFQVNVAGIENLLMAHIHISSTPVQITDPAGPIAYWFLGGPPPGDVVRERVDGRLAVGFVVTDGDLVNWNPASPDSGTVQGLIDAIRERRASVVVHTDDLNPDNGTGTAGDSRAGELRGTLE